MRYVIYGAGGIGGTIGARLSLAGFEVVLIARGEHGVTMQRDGMHFITPSMNAYLRIDTVSHPQEIYFRQDDVVFLCMKSQHTESALRDLISCCPDDTPVIVCQNGVANERVAIRRFANVYAMVVLLPTEHLSPGEVVNFAENNAGCLDAGCYPTGVDATIREVTNALAKSGFNSIPDPDVMRLKYAKLLMNLNNAVQAATGSGSPQLSDQLRTEAIACYTAAGIDFATIEESRARRIGINGGPIKGYERHGGSSLQSVLRQTGDIEADYINGEIVQLGRLHGIPTPANVVVQRVANQVAREKQRAGSVTLDELMEMIRAESVSAETLVTSRRDA